MWVQVAQDNRFSPQTGTNISAHPSQSAEIDLLSESYCHHLHAVDWKLSTVTFHRQIRNSELNLLWKPSAFQALTSHTVTTTSYCNENCYCVTCLNSLQSLSAQYHQPPGSFIHHIHLDTLVERFNLTTTAGLTGSSASLHNVEEYLLGLLSS